MVEFYFSALNFSLAQTIALLTSVEPVTRGTIRIPVPVEIFEKMFFSESGKFGFNYSDKLFSLFNLARSRLNLLSDVSFIEDVFSYNIVKSGIDNPSNTIEWNARFNLEANAILYSLNLKCQSFDATSGTDPDFVVYGNDEKYFPSESPKNLAAIVANALNFTATQKITYIPISIGDKIVFDIDVTLTGTLPGGGPIQGLKYRVEMIATNCKSKIPVVPTSVNNIPNYGLVESISSVIQLNPAGSRCSINGIEFNADTNLGFTLEDFAAFYRNFGIIIQAYGDNRAIITIENANNNELNFEGISDNVIVEAQLSLPSKTRFVSYIQTDKIIPSTQTPLPRCRSNDVDYLEYVPGRIVAVVLYSIIKRNFYLNDAGDTASEAYTYFNFAENVPVSSDVILKLDSFDRNTQFAPTLFLEGLKFSETDNLPSASDTTNYYLNYEIIDANGTTQTRSFLLDNAQCTTFSNLKLHVESIISVYNEIRFTNLGEIHWMLIPKTDLIIINSASITCLATLPIRNVYSYSQYHPHYRVVSPLPVLPWTVAEGAAPIMPVVNNLLVIPAGTHTVLEIASLLNGNVPGVRCYVLEGKYLIIEKLVPFDLFKDILEPDYAEKFGFVNNRTTPSFHWP